MAVVDTLRPTSVATTGGWTATGAANIAAATSDNSDASYAQSSSTALARVNVTSHTVPAGHERHRWRTRTRARSVSGITNLQATTYVVPGAGLDAQVTQAVGTTIADAVGEWSTRIPAAGTINPLIHFSRQSGTESRVVELYTDVDSRLPPSFTPGVLDAAGVDQAGGTVTNSNIVRYDFGVVDYDALAARSWRIAVYTTVQADPFDPATLTGAVFHREENGPAGSVADAIVNGTYQAYFQAFSTIRNNTAYGSDIETFSFTVDVAVPVGPVNLSAVPTANPPSINICWEAPASPLPWQDPTQVYAEVQRTDCNGTQRIALIENGLAACWVDRFASLSEAGRFCSDTDHTCQVCYSVRYWGVIDAELDPVTDPIPEGVILAWPDTSASIPSNWDRVTALDGRYPKGIPDGSTNPGTTGGSTSHGHTTPGHAHTVLTHSHTQSATPAAVGTHLTLTGTGTVTLPLPAHTHTRPSTSSLASHSTSTASPNLNVTSNDVPRKNMIFVESDGTDTTVPVGMTGWTADSTPPAGWKNADDGVADETFGYLKGATGNGARTFVDPQPHAHTTASHTHSDPAHGHTSANSGTATSASTNPSITGGTTVNAGSAHTHALTVSNASATNTGAASPTSATVDASQLRSRNLGLYECETPSQPAGLIGMWLGTLGSIPTGWLLCDGTNGTPNMFGRYPEYYKVGAVWDSGGTWEPAAHSHTSPGHGHTAASHVHATSVTANAGSSTPSGGGISNRSNGNHTHPSAGNTGSNGGPVTSTTVGTSNTATPEPEHTQVTFIMLEAAGTTPLSEPVRIVSAFQTVCVDSLVNPTPGNDWIRGGESGDMSICPERSWTLTRPFKTFQPIHGGVPTAVTGSEGLRDYNLSIGVTNNTDMSLLEEILGQPVVYYQPSGYGPGYEQWQAPESTAKWTDPKINRVRIVDVTFTGVNPQPAADPLLVVPEQ